MEQLKEKIENIIPLVDRLKKYYEEISSYVHDKQSNQQTLTDLTELQQLEPKLLERLQLIEQEAANHKIIFQVFEMISRYDKIIDLQSTKEFSLSMFESMITKTEGQKLINNGIDLIHHLLLKNKKNLKKNILVFFSAKIVSETLDLDEIEKLVIHYPNSMKLYIYVLQHMINRFDDKKYQILEYVERAKTIVLDRDFERIQYFRQISRQIARQPVIHYFGLIPHQLPSGSDPLKKYKKYNLICITKSTEHGIILKFSETPDQFVSDKSIEASKIIIPQPKKPEKLKFDIYENGDLDWFVFDTDGENYRVLQPWESDNDKLLPIKRHYIEGLIQFIKDKKSQNIRRISKYNLIQEDKIMKQIFLMDPIDFDQLQTEEDSSKLKQDIHNKLIKIPKHSLQDLLTKPKLYDTLLSYSYQETPLNQEEHLTAIHQLGTLKHRFVKSVFQNYMRLKDITCIRAALDETINQNTSIDKGILYKRKIVSSVKIFGEK
jgi:hypothetical protein